MHYLVLNILINDSNPKGIIALFVVIFPKTVENLELMIKFTV
jgi:hypothetical protein